MADYGDRHFDPAAGLLLLPMRLFRNVHSEHLDETPRHPVRDSLYYALVLLELADQSLQGRAEAIIARALALQETADPQAKTHGLWPYFLEEPVAVWPWPDFNWADFNGMALLLIWHRHRRRLGASLLKDLKRAVALAAGCIRRRNVDLNYTNIAIKGTFVTLSVAEVTGDGELLAYALDRLARLRDTVAATGTFAEYNSPTYAAVSLAGLHAIANYVSHPGVPALVEPMLERFWLEVAEHFHPETRELAGPHARAYTPALTQSPALLGSLIEKASRGGVCYPVKIDAESGKGVDKFGALYACTMMVEAPAAAVARLTASRSESRQVTGRVRAGPAEAPRLLTTWQEPAFCLGSVSFQDGWEQRNNLIAYWKSKDGGVGVLRHRYLRDERPCCSGYFVSEQRDGAVAAGSFLAAYADHHVAVPAEGTVCAFLGPVLEFEGCGESARVSVEGVPLKMGESKPLVVGGVVRLSLDTVAVEFRLTSHDIAPASRARPRVEWAGAGRLLIVLPHYEGRRRSIRWGDFSRAVSTYTLRMAAKGEEMPSLDGLAVTTPERMPMSQAEAETWGTECANVPA